MFNIHSIIEILMLQWLRTWAGHEPFSSLLLIKQLFFGPTKNIQLFPEYYIFYALKLNKRNLI